MTIPLLVNGITFNYPVEGDTLWGQAATNWAQAMTNGVLQKSGGLFSLASDVDFGPSGGVKAIFHGGRGINAGSGLFRAGNNESLAWRNAGNTGDANLTVNASDTLVYSTPTVSSALSVSSNGNVGIGTASPNHRLVLSAASGANIYTRHTNGTQELYAGISSANTPLIGTLSNDPLAFWANSAERMRLDAAGNVLIGATSSASAGATRLQVGSTASATSSVLVSGTSSAITLYAGSLSDTYATVRNGCSFSIGHGPDNLGSFTERMRIASDGNIGVASAPSAWTASHKAMEIRTTGLYDIIGSESGITFNSYRDGTGWKYNGSGGSATALRYSLANGAHSWFTAATGSAGAVVNFTQTMMLDSAGNLGIGTTTPSARLTVTGGPTVAGGEQNLMITSSAPTIPSTVSTGTSSGSLSIMGGSLGASGSARGGQIDFLGGGAASAAGSLLFRTGVGTGGTDQPERMRIDSSGRVNIGTASGIRTLNVRNTVNQYTDVSIQSNSTDGNTGAATVYFGNNTLDSRGYVTYDTQSNYMAFATNGAERMRLNASGQLLIGLTSPLTGLSSFLTAAADGGNLFGICVANKSATNTTFVSFANNANATAGTIAQSGSTSVIYNTSSDYRLKNNQKPLTGSGAFIDALKPTTWEWAADGTKGVGFIAHEFQAVSPSSVTGEKDAVDAEGKPVYQSMQASSSEVMANIVAELQSLRTRVSELTARVAELERK